MSAWAQQGKVYFSVAPVVIMDEYAALILWRTGPICGSVLDISTALLTIEEHSVVVLQVWISASSELV